MVLNYILVGCLCLLLADIYVGNETNSMQQQQSLYDPLSPNIHIQILLTDLYTFPWEISWENSLKDQSVFLCWSFYYYQTQKTVNSWAQDSEADHKTTHSLPLAVACSLVFSCLTGIFIFLATPQHSKNISGVHKLRSFWVSQ